MSDLRRSTPAGQDVPPVLFVVPTLAERPGLLGECLGSVRRQAVGGLDLVVVAPRDRGAEEVAARHGARFVADEHRSGISAALNTGLRAARPGTQFFAWLGDDDLLAPGSLARTIEALRARPDVALVYGWCDYVDGGGAVVFRSRAGRLAQATVGFGPNLIPQPGSLMRYDDVVAVGGLDEDLRFALDLDLFLRLRQRGRLMAIRHTLAAFRWHADSATVGNATKSMEESDRVRMRYMGPMAAGVYEYARWPGRWALSAAKWRATRNARREPDRAPR